MLLVRLRRLLFQAALLISDLVIIFLSFRLAFWLRYLGAQEAAPFATYYPSLYFSLAIWVVVLWYMGLYQVKRGWDGAELVFNVISATVVSMAGLIVVSFLGRQFALSRLTLAYVWVISTVLLALSRYVARQGLVRLRSRGIGVRKIVIMGSPHNVKVLASSVESHPEFGYKIIGLVTPEYSEEVSLSSPGNLTLADSTKAVFDGLMKSKPHSLFITGLGSDNEEIVELIASCQKSGFDVKIVPDFFQVYSSRMKLEEIGGVPLIGLKHVPLEIWERTAKRLMDLVLVSLALLLFSPFWLLLWLLLRREVGRPVLIREAYVGQNEKPFMLYRFRSGPLPKASSLALPACGRVGRFLEKYSLNHFPQVLNVIKGEMSLVGPRPERPEEVKRYNLWHRRRLLLKPGITGLAQVNGVRGHCTFDEKTIYDLDYLERQSVSLDVLILLKTIPAIISRRKRPLPDSRLVALFSEKVTKPGGKTC